MTREEEKNAEELWVGVCGHSAYEQLHKQRNFISKVSMQSKDDLKNSFEEVDYATGGDPCVFIPKYCLLTPSIEGTGRVLRVSHITKSSVTMVTSEQHKLDKGTDSICHKCSNKNKFLLNFFMHKPTFCIKNRPTEVTFLAFFHTDLRRAKQTSQNVFLGVQTALFSFWVSP